MSFGMARPHRNRFRGDVGVVAGPALVLRWPLTGVDINPTFPTGLTPTVARASDKLTQLTASTAENTGANLLSPGTFFDTVAIAGTAIESPYTNALVGAGGMTVANGWVYSFCSRLAGQSDPIGAASAIRLDSVSNVNANVAQATGLDCKDKAVEAPVWVRTKAGSHTVRFRLTNGTESQDVDFTATTTWQRVRNSVADTVFTSVGNLTFQIFADPVGGVAEIDVYLPGVVIDTTLRSSPAFTSRTADAVSLDVSSTDMRWDRGSALLNVWNLYAPTDSINHYLFRLRKGANEQITLLKTSSNKLRFNIDFGVGQTLDFTVTDVNFAQGVAHKVGISWGPDTLDIYLNGTRVATVTATHFGPGPVPAGTILYLRPHTVSSLPDSVMSNIIWYDEVQSVAFMEAATT